MSDTRVYSYFRIKWFFFDEKCAKNYGILGCAISMWEDSDGFRLVQFYSMHLIFKN